MVPQWEQVPEYLSIDVLNLDKLSETSPTGSDLKGLFVYRSPDGISRILYVKTNNINSYAQKRSKSVVLVICF